MRDDSIGMIAKSDPTILLIGSMMYERIKHRAKKKSDSLNTVRAKMRRLSHLYIHFKNFNPTLERGNAIDMFLRKNFNALKEAILAYTSDEEIQKPGLKTGIYYLVSESVKKCIGNALAEENDDFAKELGNFIVLLQHRKDEVYHFIAVVYIKSYQF